jgi:hypothetical protein
MKIILLIAGAAFSTGVVASEVVFAPNVQPCPVEIKVESNTMVRLDRSLTVTIACAAGNEAAVEWAEKRFGEWFRFTEEGWLFTTVNAPQVTGTDFSGAAVKGGDEAYELVAKPDGVMIRANTIQGVRYALYTLRQTMLPMPRNERKVKWYSMPALSVCDAPALKFRGIHIPWNMKTTPVEVEKQIRLAAHLKYNYAVIEPWGTFRSERHPWWGWKEGTMTPDAIRNIVKIGKELGITLIPQIPAFGHASMGITSPGRHAILDAHGEYAPLFESLNGWNWCLSNPEALKVQFELIDELMELFDHPAYFHIGCDEAAKPNCPECLASDYRALVISHIRALHEGLKARGAQTMLWHDMFLKSGDERWKGFYANGTEETVKALESFPRDMVICDWFYGKKKDAYPTLAYFKELGFDVVTCPWYERCGTAAQGVAARKHGILGMLVTTWGAGQGKQRGKFIANMFAAGACAAWGAPYYESPLWKWGYDLDFIRNLRDVVHDMRLEDHDASGAYKD